MEKKVLFGSRNITQTNGGHTRMANLKNLLFRLIFLLAFVYHPAGAETTGQFIYSIDGENYPCSIKQTGENHTFEFEKSPVLESRKLKAALHVFQSVYDDSSINTTYSETFMKEGAMCFVFNGNFYSYRACFLPNDYSPGNRDRFWGFVSRLPNATWLITRNLLPAILVLGLFFFFPKKSG